MDEKYQQRVEEHLLEAKTRGYENIIGVFLQGSQNYHLDYDGSDVDTKAIVLPKFEDFVLTRNPISTTSILDNNEHVDVKDIRLMFNTFKKQNINFVEILFTEYRVISPEHEKLLKPLFDAREKIVRYNPYAALNCMAGMAMEKYKALEHPYPNTVEKITRYGYDPKQLHYILRMSEFADRYAKNEESFAEMLIPSNPLYLIDVKKGIHSLDEARKLAKEHCEKVGKIKDHYMSNNPCVIDNNVDEILGDVLFKVLKNNFKKELI